MDSVGIPDEAAVRRRTIIAAVAAVVVVAVVALGSWALFGRPQPAGRSFPGIEPAEETTAAPGTEPTGSAEASRPAGSNGSGEPTSSEGANDSKIDALPKQKIAFRLGRSVYVANSDGSDPRAAAAVADGDRFALSPDGKTLAITTTEESPSGAGITLVDMSGSGRQKFERDAVPGSISWAANSQWFAYAVKSGSGFEARRSGRDGSGDVRLASPALIVRVSPDTRRIAYVPDRLGDPSVPLTVMTLPSGLPREVPEGRGATSWEWLPNGHLLFVRPGLDKSFKLWEWDPTSQRSSLIAETTVVAPAFNLAHLTVSPAGRAVVMAAIGDDGYSRLMLLDLETRAFDQLETRRDSYPLTWARGEILYFEGNRSQGEASSLMRIRPRDGARFMVISGASP